MTKEWWGADVVPRIQWKLLIPRSLTVTEGNEIPHGYGIAYYTFDRPVAVCYPLPINLIIGAWRSLLWHFRCPPWRFTEYRANLPVVIARREGYREGVEAERSRNDPRERIAHENGYRQGHHDAFVNFETILDSLAPPRTVIVEKGSFDGIVARDKNDAGSS